MTRRSSARTRSTCSTHAARSRSPSGRRTSDASAGLPGEWPRRISVHKRKMPSLLLEIGAEELPAGACREAEAQLAELARAHVGKAPSQLFVGPRRLGFVVDDLPERTADECVNGPPENLRERAATGFAKKHGVSADALEVREGFLGVTVPGRELREVLPEQIDRIVRG